MPVSGGARGYPITLSRSAARPVPRPAPLIPRARTHTHRTALLHRRDLFARGFPSLPSSRRSILLSLRTPLLRNPFPPCYPRDRRLFVPTWGTPAAAVRARRREGQCWRPRTTSESRHRDCRSRAGRRTGPFVRRQFKNGPSTRSCSGIRRVHLKETMFGTTKVQRFIDGRQGVVATSKTQMLDQEPHIHIQKRLNGSPATRAWSPGHFGCNRSRHLVDPGARSGVTAPVN